MCVCVGGGGGMYALNLENMYIKNKNKMYKRLGPV